MEHPAIGREIDRPAIDQRLFDRIAKLLVELCDSRSVSHRLPIRPLVDAEPLVHHGEPDVTHEVVVHFLEVPVQVVALECPTRDVLVVENFDVVVRVATGAIHVGDHQDIAVRMESLRELVPEIRHHLNLLWIALVDLRVLEALDQ